MKTINKYKLIFNLVLAPLVVFNPIGEFNPVGFGGWGVDVWPKLVVLLLSYVIIYHYLYFYFWTYVEDKIYKYFDLFFEYIGGFNLDPSFNVMHLEEIILLIEFLCYHYFLYFLFIL